MSKTLYLGLVGQSIDLNSKASSHAMALEIFLFEKFKHETVPEEYQGITKTYQNINYRLKEILEDIRNSYGLFKKPSEDRTKLWLDELIKIGSVIGQTHIKTNDIREELGLERVATELEYKAEDL